MQWLECHHREEYSALFAFLLAGGFFLHTHNPSNRVIIFLEHMLPLLFSYWQWEQIVSVGIETLALESSVSFERQTVILWHTPAHLSPSLHLCDLELLKPPDFLPPSLLLPSLSRREKRCFLSTLLPFQRFPTKSDHMAPYYTDGRGARCSQIPNAS